MMETYGATLVGTCTMLLGDKHTAQDIVQETFIRAYKKMDSFRGERPESEKAWLTRIAVNLCRDERRKQWRLSSSMRRCSRCRRNTAR